MSDAAPRTMRVDWDPAARRFVATVSELPGCVAYGRTRAQAVQQGAAAIRAWLGASGRGRSSMGGSAMEHERDRDHDDATAPEADTGAAEYLAGDDRTKAHGYNHLPHRPRKPDQRRQVAEARHAPPPRAPQADDAGGREDPAGVAADIDLNKEGPT